MGENFRNKKFLENFPPFLGIKLIQKKQSVDDERLREREEGKKKR